MRCQFMDTETIQLKKLKKYKLRPFCECAEEECVRYINNKCERLEDKEMIEELKSIINDETIIVCIGTDKNIGDCVGPLVGTMLTESNFKYPVYGTIDNPIHALNIHERINEINRKHPKANIIAIDACLGDDEDIGKIRLRDYGISPGKGVGKELPKIGNASIVAIVSSSDDFEFFSTRPIRLSFIMNMAKDIANSIKGCV